jgi:hypothetical protein
MLAERLHRHTAIKLVARQFCQHPQGEYIVTRNTGRKGYTIMDLRHFDTLLVCDRPKPEDILFTGGAVEFAEQFPDIDVQLSLFKEA